jgi:hypothetical protein
MPIFNIPQLAMFIIGQSFAGRVTGAGSCSVNTRVWLEKR